MKKNIFFGIAMLLVLSYKVSAQPSLSSGDIKELVINYNGKTESYTVMCDAVNRNQWYYIPKEPRLTEKIINGIPNPELTLLRYQFVDPSNEDHSFDGGILQFSVSLSPEPAGVTALKKALKSELDKSPAGAPANLSIAALQLKTAQASIYTLGGGDSSKLVSKSFGGGIFPTYASQKAPFSLYLTKWGADINDALIGNSASSNTGVPIAISLTYQALTPPAQLKIKANYKKIFDHYSNDRVFAAKASYFGLFGASTQMRWTTINEKLSVDGSLTVEKIQNEEISDSNMNQVMQSVMKRINDQILQITSPPPSIPPATAEMPTLNDRFGSVGYNVTTKSVHFESEYVDSFIWNERKLVERSTLAGGFIGIGNYPEDIRKNAVQFVPGFNWDLAHFTLPEVGNINQLTQIINNTQLFNEEKIVSTQSAIWKPSNGWRAIPSNRPITTLDFSIAALINKGVDRKNLKFKTITTIIQAGRTIEIAKTQDVIQSGIPVAPPTEGLSTIVFDAGDLKFRKIDTAFGKLLRVSVSMKVQDKVYSEILQPKLNGSLYSLPNPIVWIIKDEDLQKGQLKVAVKFDYINGSNPLTKTIYIDNLVSETDGGLNLLLRDPIY